MGTGWWGALCLWLPNAQCGGGEGAACLEKIASCRTQSESLGVRSVSTLAVSCRGRGGWGSAHPCRAEGSLSVAVTEFLAGHRAEDPSALGVSAPMEKPRQTPKKRTLRPAWQVGLRLPGVGISVHALADSLENWRKHRAFPQKCGPSEGTEWRAVAATQNQLRGLEPFSPEMDALFVRSRGHCHL